MFFWGLKFELRDRIANITKNKLIEIINVVANYELILEQERTDKKSSFYQKLVYLVRMYLSPLLSRQWRFLTTQTRGRDNRSVENVGRSI